MRPVLLEMNGFASFRVPARIDFSGTDYFALVGPTGAGKSTVIDAITFALYGTADRWGRANAVRDALAPTATHAAVRLVFDIGTERYAIARQVRRTASAISQRNVSLERLTDQNGTGGTDEAPGVVLASDPKEANQQVATILGLSFDEFTKCVVLPQGKFSQFLVASKTERREIMIKLLGGEHYEAVRIKANERASLAGQSLTLLDQQLAELGDIDGDDAAVKARVDTLEDLDRHVAELTPQVHSAVQQVELTAAEHRRLGTEMQTLSGVAVPAGLAESTDAARQSAELREAAIKARDLAEARHLAALTAVEAGAKLHELQAQIALHTELSALRADHDRITETAREAGAAQSAAEQAFGSAEQEHTARLADVHQAEADLATADVQLRAVEQRGQRLDQLARAFSTTHQGQQDLAAALIQARERRTETEQQRELADAAEQHAREAAEAAGERADWQARLERIAAVGRLSAETEALAAELEALHSAVAAAATDAEAAAGALTAAQQELSRQQEHQQAAALRTHLVTGQPCPVCEQPVTTVPAADDAADLASSRAAVRQAAAAAEQTQRTVLAAEASVMQQEQAVARHTEQHRLALAALGQYSDPTVASAAVEVAQRASHHLQRAVESRRAATEAAQLAERELRELDERLIEARRQLQAAVRPLIADGAPELDDADLGTAWARLCAWADAQRTELATLQTGAVTLRQSAAKACETARQAASVAENDRRQAQHDHVAAVRTAQAADDTLARAAQRITELAAAVAGGPTATDLEVAVELAQEREAAAADAGATYRQARTAYAAAETEHQRLQLGLDRARGHFRVVRDELVPLGAPTADDRELGAAWQALVGWAEEQSAVRSEQMVEAQQASEQAEQHRQDLGSTLRELLAIESFDLPGDLASARGISASHLAVQVRLAEQRRELEARAAVRERVARLTERRQQTAEAEQVARSLDTLLRANRFPDWLAAAALDTLVTGASATLRELSGGQFSLTHDRSDFFVIDHHDADAQRSVRTLSGGETFQASLALALALSAQMSELAAGGRAHLDSIFLDEGFGSLDPEALDVVAGTLETLSQGRQMVGVITHVAALAEQIPVRFQVRRDSQTSRVTREEL